MLYIIVSLLKRYRLGFRRYLIPFKQKELVDLGNKQGITTGYGKLLTRPVVIFKNEINLFSYKDIDS